MYLVIVRHTIDDIPLALFDGLEDAKAYAAQTWDFSPAYHDTDASTPIAVAVVKFLQTRNGWIPHCIENVENANIPGFDESRVMPTWLTDSHQQ